MAMEDLFTKEVLRWRSVRALFWCLICQLIGPLTGCCIYSMIFQGVLNPLTVLYNVISLWIFPTCLTIPLLCFLLLARVHNKSSTVNSWVPITRWDTWRRVFSLATILRSLLIMIVCALLTNFYVSLATPELPSILQSCVAEDVVCIKRKSFILYMGLLNGCRYAYHYFMENGNLLVPAPIYATKLQQVKSRITFRKMKEAYSKHGPSVIYFLVMGIVINLSNSNSWSDGMVILDLPLMITMIMASIFLAITLTLFVDIFHVFVTEPIEFPLMSGEDCNPETDTDSWKLSHALSSSGLLQLLAFSDLKSMATSEARNLARRSQVFAISQPGGHPRNWLGIMNPSLNLIRKFTERLRRHNCPEEFAKPTVKLAEPVSTSTDINKNAVVKPLTISMKDKSLKVLSNLKKFPVFAYFLSELPDATNRRIFADALPVIWAVQALGDLVAASFTEDKYGVAQRNIPDILMAFVQLQKVVDSLSRGTISKRAGTSDTLPPEFKLRRALRSALRSAMYSVTTTFGVSILEVKMTVECQTKLQSYLDFKEG